MSSLLRLGSKYRVTSQGPSNGGVQLSARLRDASSSPISGNPLHCSNPLISNQVVKKAKMKLAALERENFKQLKPWQRELREHPTNVVPEYDEDGRTDCRDLFQLRNSVIPSNLL